MSEWWIAPVIPDGYAAARASTPSVEGLDQISISPSTIDGAPAPTVLALMRSRFTSYGPVGIVRSSALTSVSELGGSQICSIARPLRDRSLREWHNRCIRTIHA